MTDLDIFPELPPLVSNSPYVTRIEIEGWGGSVMVGRLNDDVAQYWIGKDHHDFGEHLFEKERSVELKLDGSAVNSGRGLPERYEADSVGHAWGAEIAEGLEVKATSENYDMLLRQPGQPAPELLGTVDETTFGSLDGSFYHVYGRTYEWVRSTFYIEDDIPYDMS